MPNLTPFENALLILCAVLTAVLWAIMWWRIAGERVKALVAGWLALPLLWKIVLSMVFGAFVLHGSVKKGEVSGEGEEVVGDSCSGRKEGGNSILQLQLKTTTITSSLLQSHTLSDEDITRGYWLESVITNAYDYSAIPPTANEYWQWCRRGGYDMYRVQRFGDFLFPYGTNIWGFRKFGWGYWHAI